MSNVAEAVQKQHEKRTQNSSFEQTDLTKYFTIALEKGITSGEKIFRMLPPMNPEINPSPFVEVYFHVVEVGGKQRKLYDPGKNEGKPSPLTEVGKDLLASGDPGDKKLAAKFRSRLYYIIKGIERGREHEGVKFWRFPHENNGKGVFDLLTTIFKRYGDITDPQTGCDLSIALSKVKDQRGKEYTAITSILPLPASPLSVNAELAKQWLEDKMTWESVYKKYDHDYLQIVAEQRIPMWSETEKKWVPKPEADTTASTSTQADIGEAVGGAPATPPAANIPTVAEVAEGTAISEDDLPF